MSGVGCEFFFFLLRDQEKTSVNATEPADVSSSQDAHTSMWLCRCQT